MAMSVMPATAAITIQRVLFFSPPAPAWAAAALVSVGAGELNPAEEENKELPYVRESRVMDSGLFVSGTWIPDSLSCPPDSKAQDSRFYKQKSPAFQIPQAKNSQIRLSGFPYMGRKYGTVKNRE